MMRPLIQNKTFWLLALVCALTLLPVLGLSDYHTKGEPRESIVSYSMLASDNWILPRNNGGEIAYKPPFFHWCVAAVSLLRGEVTEATSRLPSALALILMTLGGFAFLARRKGVTVALTAALVTFTSFEIHRAGANCRVDMVLTALTVGAIYCLYGWYERGMKGVPWLAILLMGLGTMTKGPVGSIIPCLAVGVFLLLRRVGFMRAFLSLFAFGLLSLAIYGLWFYAAWGQGGQEFLDLMYEENIGRMTNTMSYDSCVEPWPYNILTVILGWIPWTVLGLVALFFADYGRLRPAAVAGEGLAGWLRGGLRKLRAWIDGMDDVDLFSLTTIAVIFVFYCIPQSKRSVYLMPIYPFMGYFIARGLLRASAFKPRMLRIYGDILAVLTSVLFVVFLLVKAGLVPECVFGSGRHAAQNVAMMRALGDIGGVAGWLTALVPTVVGVAWWRARKVLAGGPGLVYTLITIIFSLYIALDFIYTPTVLNVKSVKAISAEIDRMAPESEGTLYEYIDAGVKAKGDPVHFFEVNFYLRNRIENFHRDKPASGFLLISQGDAEACFPDFERQGYRFTLRYKAPKRGLELYRFERAE